MLFLAYVRCPEVTTWSGRRWPHPPPATGCDFPRTDINLPLIGLFRWPDRPELPVQHKVVSDFERPGNEERNINQRMAREQEAGKDGAERGSRGPRYSGDSTGRRAFLRPHHGHRIGLPCRHVHLADTESDEQDHDC